MKGNVLRHIFNAANDISDRTNKDETVQIISKAQVLVSFH